MTVQHEPFRQAENFPVASWIIPAIYRPTILAFYDFARGADELADAVNVPDQEKLEALQSLSQAWQDKNIDALPSWVQPLLHQLPQHPTLHTHAANLLQAFIQDCVQPRYAQWNDLIDYCMHSAAPVGRAVLDICGEQPVPNEASDALCVVLQVINHLQDTKDDLMLRDRIYWPQTMLEAHGVKETMLQTNLESTHVTALKHDIIARCDTLLKQSTLLIPAIHSWRLRREITIIYHVAQKLCCKLRNHDILTQRVSLSRRDKLACVFRGLMR